MSPPQGMRAAANPPLWAQPQPSASWEAAEFTGQESQWHLLFVQKSLLELHGETGEEIDACKLCVCMKGAGGGVSASCLGALRWRKHVPAALCGKMSWGLPKKTSLRFGGAGGGLG